LTVHYSDKRREVRLNRGEANFEVVKNTRQPFVVRAGDGLVWAVGTTFNVRYTHPAGDTDKTAVNVMVTEGTVKVFTDIAKVSQAKLTVDPKELQQEQLAVVNTQSTGKNTQPEKPSLKNQRQSLLTAGQSIRFTEVINDKEVLPQAQIEKQLAWHNGVIIFDGETLEQALLEVSRYTDKELRIVDPAIRNIPVGGHYKTNNIDALLASLSDGFGIAVKSVGDNRVHLSAK
jgi:transmembrane sensor